MHLQFCKHLLGVRIQTQNDFIYGELGRVPLQQRRYITIIKYWFKLLKCDNHKYIKIIYDKMFIDTENASRKKSWAKKR